MQTLAAFIEKHRVRMTCAPADSNPHMVNDDWARTARHWRCVVRVGRRSMVVPFSQGAAHTSAPTVADVLSCVVSDVRSFNDATGGFEEWARDLGYDEDSRRARKTWTLIAKRDAALGRLLGADVASELIFDTETH